MKKILLMFLLASSTVFAGRSDLLLLNTLLEVGVTSIPVLKVEESLQASDVTCIKQEVAGKTICYITDVRNDKNKDLTVYGEKADIIFNAINDSNSQKDDLYVSSPLIYCSLFEKGISHDSENETKESRARCSIDEHYGKAG